MSRAVPHNSRAETGAIVEGGCTTLHGPARRSGARPRRRVAAWARLRFGRQSIVYRFLRSLNRRAGQHRLKLGAGVAGGRAPGSPGPPPPPPPPPWVARPPAPPAPPPPGGR